MIGYVNLYAFHDTNRRCDIGYALAQAHWGKGYLPEALAGMIDYGFRALDLNRIAAPATSSGSMMRRPSAPTPIGLSRRHPPR